MGNAKGTKNPDIENILCKRIKPLGVEKFTNDDFGVVGYLIPRSVIQNKLNIAESDLYNKCIYFLIGTVNTKEVIYVGQADVRNNGKSVLKRLQEHIFFIKSRRGVNSNSERMF